VSKREAQEWCMNGKGYVGWMKGLVLGSFVPSTGLPIMACREGEGGG